MKNCPTDFYVNCSNAGFKCNQCICTNPAGKLYYEPVEDTPELTKHPYKKDVKKSARFRQAVQTEKNIQKSIAKHTLRSGAALGDGDLRLLNGSADLRVEIKDRGKKSSFCVTWQEYSKGKQQGIDAFAIQVECPDGKRRTVYVIDEQLFTTFIALTKDKLENQS